MDKGLLHIYRNVPSGRETLMGSLYFASLLDIDVSIYIPRHKKFNMYFKNGAVQVTLDRTYLMAPHLAQKRVQEIVKEFDVFASIFEAREFSASVLPDVPTDSSFMTCPKVISEVSAKLKPGHIGPSVRNILLHAEFPVLIPSEVFKPWKSLLVMFGGSDTSLKALFLAREIAKISGFPFYLFTQQEEERPKKWYEERIFQTIGEEVLKEVERWYFFEHGDMETNLFEVPHDSIVVAGLFAHGIIKELVFGSVLELIQSYLPNNLLLVGPNFNLGE